MNILVIDKLRRESQYRTDFWNIHRGLYANVAIDIPELGDDGNPVGTSNSIDLNSYQFVLVHQTDDKYTGYAADASKCGLNVVRYSDARDEQSTRRHSKNLIEMQGKLLYARLGEFLRIIDQTQIVDLLALSGIDEELESLFSELCTKLPFAEFWDGPSLNKRRELIRTIERKYGIKLT